MFKTLSELVTPSASPNLRLTIEAVSVHEIGDYQKLAERFRTAFGARRVSFRELSPGLYEMDVLRVDPLAKGLSPDEFQRMIAVPHSWSALPVGRTDRGSAMLIDAVAMPHFLIGGTTGAGKSGSMHALLAAAVASKEGANLLLCDPKKNELLDWVPLASAHAVEDDSMVELLEAAVEVMEQRYRFMAARNVRNLWQEADVLAGLGGPVVIVVDELADLLATARRDAGEPLTRLAQKGRAAAMQVVVATQNPKAELFSASTGTTTLRTNLNTAIALRTGRVQDSDVILGSGSATSGIDASTIDPSIPGTALTREGVYFRFPYLGEQDIATFSQDRSRGSSIDELLDLALATQESE